MAAYERNDNCPIIEGKDEEMLTVGKFRVWFMLYTKWHVVPDAQRSAEILDTQKQQIASMEQYITEDRIEHAKIAGGIKVGQWMIAAGVVLISALLTVLSWIYLSQVGELKNKVDAGVLPVAKERLDQQKQRIERLEKERNGR